MHRKKLSALLCALACLLVSGCGQAKPHSENSVGATNSTVQIAPPSGSQVQGESASRSALGEIVTPEVLGTNLKYVESLIGRPAMRTITDGLGIERNFYKRDDCYIEVGAKDARVVSVGAGNLGAPGCDLNVAGLVNRSGGPVMASSTRYGDYTARGPLHFTDVQIPGCNACGEGLPYAMIDGFTAMGNFDVQLSGDGDFEAGSKWRELIWDSGMDTRKLPTTRENCPLRIFDAQGFELMKNLKVTGIAFGFPNALQPACSGEAVHDQNVRRF